MTDRIAENYKDAFNALGLELITRENFTSYYVERSESPILELKSRIEIDNTPSKFLFTGLRASGKTTELRRLMFMLEESHFIVYFSVLDTLDLTDVTYIDLLLCMGLKTLSSINERQVKIDSKVIEDMYVLFAEITGERIVSQVEKQSTETGLSGKLTLLVAEVLSRYKSEFVTRIEIREKIENKVQDFLDRFNSLIIELQNKVNKPLLLLVDDLEKLDLQRAEEICYKHCSTITRPICKVLFTIPVSLIYAPCWKQLEMSFVNAHYFLPLKCVKTQKDVVDENGVNFLKNIVLKRVSSNLFDQQALESMALRSGGVVVDYLRMVRDCCVKAQARGLPTVDQKLADQAFTALVDSYKRPLEDKYYPKLIDINKKKNATNDEDLRFLLYLCVVLEYNGKIWYNVHPAIEQILYEKGLLTSG